MKYILCQPAVKRFEWELEVCITRLKKLGIQEIVLLFTQWDDQIPQKLKDKYRVETHMYSDKNRDKTYIPSVKPYLWMHYLKEDPTRESSSYFYLDGDVLLREIPDVTPTENTWYTSDCHSYLGVDYIDSKGADLLDRMCRELGIDSDRIRRERPTGGAQWLIKNPTYEYWEKVYGDSIKLYKFLSSVESEYVKNQSSNYVPIQKWTAEMWAQLWNVYHFGKTVRTSDELDFCWPTDPVERYQETKIYHNAGVQDDRQNLFFKGKYVNKTPFGESLDQVDRTKASIEYIKAIKEVARMAKYEVLESFRDLEEDKEYFKGDHFPKPAKKKVDDKRLRSLSSKNNKAGRPLIKEIERMK